MLLVVHRIDCDLYADFGHARHVNGNLDEVCVRDERIVLRRDVFALLHETVCLFERLCDGDILVADARIMERFYHLFKGMICDNGGHDALHECHLCNQTAPHLPHAHNARADDLALFLTLCKLFVHIQHTKLLPPPFGETSTSSFPKLV